MDQRIVRLRMMRQKKAEAMKNKAEEENGGKLKMGNIVFPLLLMLQYPQREPGKTNIVMTHWLKNRYKEGDEILQFLESIPMVWACYYDDRGLTLEVSQKKYTRHIIKRLLGLLPKYYTVNAYVYGCNRYTAYSPVHRVSNENKVAMLAGVVQGRFICETGVTVRHFFTNLDRPPDSTEDYDELDVGGGIVGKCCGKEREVVVDGKKYTADIAAISFLPSPDNPVSYDCFGLIDIFGQIYQSRLWMGDEDSLLPGTRVWMVNQDGELKKGRICRLLIYDKNLKLYNVMQIVSENFGERFSKMGDSGCSIFFPPSGADHMVHVIGMVIGEVKYVDGLRLTTGVRLGKVLPPFLRALLAPNCLKGPHPLSRDYNLPFGVDYAEGLEFSGSVGMYDNLTVESLQPSFSDDDRSGVTEVRLKEFGPSGGLVRSYNCTPVECSEDTLKEDVISGDSGVISEIDAPASVISDAVFCSLYSFHYPIIFVECLV